MNDSDHMTPDDPHSPWSDDSTNSKESAQPHGAESGAAPETTVTPELLWARPVHVPVATHPILLFESSKLAALADLGLFAVIFIAFALAGEIAVRVLAHYTGGKEALPALFLPLTLYRLLAAVAVTASLLFWRRQSTASVGLEARRVVVNLLLGLVTLVAAFALIYGIFIPLSLLFPELLQQMQQNTSQLEDVLAEFDLLEMVIMMIAVGIYEELVFRGFVMTRLRRVTGSWTIAVVLSSAVFAALHLIDQTPAAVLFVGLLSIVLSLVTIWRRSLLPAIVAHILFNLAQVVGLQYFT